MRGQTRTGRLLVTTPSRSAARRIATARLISLPGSQAAFTALVVAVYRRTGSPGWISAVLLVGFWTGGLLAPVAGSLGDRFDRRRVMIVSDLAGAVAFVSFGLAFPAAPSALLILAFLDAATAAPFSPAASAAVPNLVADDDLAWANGTIAFGTNVGYLAGPALGGLLAAVTSPRVVFLANAASYVVSALLVASVRGRFSRERRGGDRTGQGGIWSGFGFIARDPVLRTMALAFVPFAVAVGSVLVAELPLAEAFGTGSFGYGLLGSSFGIGAMVGALGGRRLTTATERRAVVIGSVVTAAGLLASSRAPVFWVVLAGMVVSGAADGVVDVAIELTFQRRPPDHLRSRVLAALEGIFLLGLAVSFLFAGAFVGRFGPKAAYALAGGGCFVTAIMLTPLLRRGFGDGKDASLGRPDGTRR
jgi:MFS family permease